MTFALLQTYPQFSSFFVLLPPFYKRFFNHCGSIKTVQEKTTNERNRKNITMDARKCLANTRILIADSDRHMLTILKKILGTMGFGQFRITDDSNEALDIISKGLVDIVITEWDMKLVKNASIIENIRHSEDSAVALMPVILLSANSTKTAVKYSRDCGATEFLAKPYTARTLYNRLEHVIDFPRNFIVSDDYVGPDRRRKTNPYFEGDDRRTQKPTEFGLSSKIRIRHKSPVKILTGSTLRRKLKIPKALREIITEEILQEAETAILSFKDESMKWMTEDVTILKTLTREVIEEHDVKSITALKRQALRLKSHAGTFHYDNIARWAESFYQFMEKGFVFKSMKHHLVLKKYIEVIQILIAKRILSGNDIWAMRLLEGLNELVANVKHHTPANNDAGLNQEITDARI